MQYDGSIRINTKLYTGDFDKGADRLKSSLLKISNSMRNILKAFGFGLGIAGLVRLGKEAIETASDIEEVQNVVDTAFGDMSYKMERFADTAVKQFGISKLSAKEMGSTFMAMGASMVDSMEAASDMAINLTARAADMSSFYNKSAQETATALKSIYTGETETLKQYGVVMTEVNLQEYAAAHGINKKISAMTQAEKVQLRYNYVMEQTALAAGDFAKTSDSWANQVRILNEQFKEFLSIIGTGLIRVFTPVIKFLNTVLAQLIAITKQAGALISKFLGISIPVSDSKKFSKDMTVAAGGAEELAEGVEEARKEAKKALAPFDDLQVLAKESGGAAGGISGGISGGGEFSIPELDIKETEEDINSAEKAFDGLIKKLKQLKDIFMQGFWDGLGDWEYRWESIKNSIKSIKDSLVDIFTDSAVVAAADQYVKSVAYMFGSLVGSLASIGLTIATNLVGGIAKYLEQNKDRIKEYLISMFDIWTEINMMFAELFQSIAYVFEAFASDQGQQLTANIIGILASAFMGITELASKLLRDIANIIIQPFLDNKEAFRTALEGFLNVLEEVTGTIKQGIDDTFDKINEVYDEHFKPFFDSVAQGLSDLTGQFLEFWNNNAQPILDKWAEKFDGLWTEHIQPFINNFIDLLGSLADMLKALWENILQPFATWLIDEKLPTAVAAIGLVGNAFFTLVGIIADAAVVIIGAIRNIVDFLTNVFQGNWEAAWGNIVNFLIGPLQQRMKESGTNIIEGIKNGIKEAWDSLLDLISFLGESIKERFCSLLGIHSPSTVFEGFGRFLIEGLANGISGTADLVTSIIGDVVDGILGMFSFDKWSEAGQNMINSIVSAIETFRETWNESFSSWIEDNEELYFGYDIWYEQWQNILTAYNDVNSEFMSQWQNNMNIWWTTMVMPYFTVLQWKTFGENMKNGIMQGFKAIANNIAGVLNQIIQLFNAAYKELQDAMNELIDDYNSKASQLGTSKLSHVKYNPMDGVKVPQLATGAVIRGGNPFMAILGDQPAGQTNIEAPLSTIEQAVENVISRQGYNRESVPVNINLNYDGETFARLSISDILSELGRQGFNVDVLGVTL